MAGYIRQSTFSDGDTITAALFNNEYDQLLTVFSNTLGHKHDGTAAEGPVIGLIGDAGLVTPLNKILIDTTNDHIEFWIDVSGTSTQQLYIADGAILPVTDNDIDLGSSSLEFKDLYIDGTANIDSLVADTADINGGTLDNVTIGSTTAAAGTFTTVDTSGNVTVGGNLTVSGTTTTVNSNEVNIGDNIIVLNSDETGTPSQNGGIEVERGTSTNVSLLWNETNDYWTFGSNHLNFPDNSKAYFGTGNDLQIYHDGSNSYIKDGGTGNLRIAGQSVDILNPDANEFKARFIDNGKVELYYDNSKKFETTSAGIDVTGSITASGIDNLLYLQSGATGTPTLRFEQGTTRRAFLRYQNAGQFDIINEYGDVAFWTGTSGSESQKMTVKQDGKVGIGTSSPIGKLDVSDGTNPVSIDSGSTYNEIQSYNRPLYVNRQGNNTILNSGGGNVGIGTNSPAYKVHQAVSDSGVNYLGFTNSTTGSAATDGLKVGINEYEEALIWNHENSAIRFATNNTQRMAILNSGNVGIGTTSPGARLQINGSSADSSAHALIARNSGGTSLFSIRNDGRVDIPTGNLNVTNDVAVSGNLTVTGNATINGNLTFGNAATDTVSFGADIDSHIIPDDDDTYDLGSSTQQWRDLYLDGVAYLDQVGIGTDSPSEKLHVNSGTTDKVAIFESSDTTATIELKDPTASSQILNSVGMLILKADPSNASGSTRIGFEVDGTERARIDSSGNLLVGTTSSSNTSDGVRIKPDGFISVANTSNSVLFANRLSTDGSIVVFQKDGTTVGTIGTNGGNIFLSDGGRGIAIDGGVVYPTYSDGGIANNVQDLGRSDRKWRDLYLGRDAFIDGNVGIGTDSPSSKLDLTGSGTTQIEFNNTGQSSTSYVGNDATGLFVGTTTNHPIRISTNNTEAIRIDSSQRVGIGTGSPNSGTKVHIAKSGEAYARVESTSGGGARLQLKTETVGYAAYSKLDFIYGASDTVAFSINGGDTVNTMAFDVGGSERMRINSSGNVGIGTSSPFDLLDVAGSGNVGLRIRTSGGGTPQLKFHSAAGLESITSGVGSVRNMTFNVGDSERARIDSSGNLLVGKTSGSLLANDGIELRNDGAIYATKASGSVLFLNRKTSDGTIVDFRKDNTTVGTISISNSGTDLAIDNTRFSDRAGLLFRNGALFPRQNAANADNAIDLGGSNAQFKDLYLGGNATIGGNLTVSGTTTTIDTTNLNVEDKNITINYSTGDSSSTADGAGITIQDAVDASTDASLTWNATDDNFEISHGLDFGDNSKARFGGSNDLQIFHDGSNSFINDTGTGNLLIRAADSFFVQDTGGKTYIKTVINAQTELSHNNSLKLATTSTGIDVTGGADAIAKVTGTTTAARLDLATTTHHVFMQVIESDGRFRIYDQTAANEYLTISNAGNVGIGTTSPAAKLDVRGDIELNSTFPVLRFKDSDSENDFSIIGGSGLFRIYDEDATASRISVNSSGNVGIGTDSPSTALHVYRATTDTVATFESGDPSVAVNFTASDNSMQITTSGTDGIVKNNGAGSFRLFNNGSERARIDSSGNVLIGATSPKNTFAEKTLSVISSASNSQGMIEIGGNNTSDSFISGLSFTNEQSTDTSNFRRIAQIFAARDGNNNAGDLVFNVHDGSTLYRGMTIKSSGNIGIGTDSPNNKLEVIETSAGAETTPLQLRNSNTTAGTATNLRFVNSTVANSTGAGVAEITNVRTDSPAAGATALTFTTSSGTGLAERVRIDGNGNVGIGTTSPAEHLHIKDATYNDSTTVRIEGFTSSGGDPVAQLEFYNTTSAPSAEVAGFIKLDSASGGRRQYEMSFGTGNNGAATTQMLLDKNGQLGIGTTSPSALLDVNINGNTGRFSRSGTQYIEVSANSGGQSILSTSGTNKTLFIGTTDSNQLRLQTNGSNALSIDSSQNVGIGTTSPSATYGGKVLHIENNDNSAIKLHDTTGSQLDIAARSGDVLIYEQDGYPIRFGINGTEGMRLTSTGLGIGTSSPDRSLVVNHASDARVKLQENGTDAMQLQATSSEARVSAIGGSTPLAFHTNGAERARINNSGNVGIGTTSPVSKLHVYNSSGTTPAFTTYNAGNSSDITSFAAHAALQLICYQSEGNPYTKTSALIANADGTVPSEMQFWTKTSGASSAAERIRIDSSGNVGIGTSSPSEKLHVNGGDVLIEDSYPVLGFLDGTASSEIQANSGNLHLSSDHDNNQSSSRMTFAVDGSEAMRINSSGSVLVGKTAANIGTNGIQLLPNSFTSFTRTNDSPMYLVRAGSGGSILEFSIGGGGTDSAIGTTGSDDMTFYTGAAATDERMRLTTTGLGIGTTSPTVPLEVSGHVKVGDADASSAAGDSQLNVKAISGEDAIVRVMAPSGNDSELRLGVLGTSGVNSLKFGDVLDNDVGYIQYDHGSNYLRFGTNAGERARIDSSGNFGIGTTHPDSRLDVTGGDITVNVSGTGLMNYKYNNSVVGSITTNGISTAFNTSSDARLKDITGSARGLEVINELNPVAYDWKADGKSDEGLIAQEVKELVPNAVSETEEGYYQMDYSKLVTPLIKAVQEQQKEIEELKKHSHSPKGLENMEGYENLIETIESLKAEIKLLKGGN